MYKLCVYVTACVCTVCVCTVYASPCVCAPCVCVTVCLTVAAPCVYLHPPPPYARDPQFKAMAENMQAAMQSQMAAGGALPGMPGMPGGGGGMMPGMPGMPGGAEYKSIPVDP